MNHDTTEPQVRLARFRPVAGAGDRDGLDALVRLSNMQAAAGLPPAPALMVHHGGRHRAIRSVFQPQHRQARVTVVIPAHNEAGSIADTLTAVLGQSRKPDAVFVVADNCTDLTTEVASRFPVTVVCSVGNQDKKAGALNRILSVLLPGLTADDIVMGFDADSCPDDVFIENAARWIQAGKVAVGATFYGREGGGVLGQLQRSEFARFARHQHRKARADVLSGTGWAVRVDALRRLAESRPDRQVYDTKSICEDFELTLALRHQGAQMVAPSDCRVTTDVMTRVKDLITQRLRWQHGTLVELRSYGWTSETRGMIVRQALIYLAMVATPAVVVYLFWSFLLFGLQGINPAHARFYAFGIVIVVLEQAWQSRKAGRKAVLLTLLILPDFAYSIFRQVVYLRALHRFLRNKKISWGAGTAQ